MAVAHPRAGAAPAQEGRSGRRFEAPHLVWLLVGLGAVLRLAVYLRNRSLWLDEAMLAPNIIDVHWLDIDEPLRYRQATPAAFLMLMRLASSLLGPSEYVLRLVPLLAGIGAIVLMVPLARTVLRPAGAALAVALVAISGPLIYYSSELKQYGSDAAVAAAILLIGSRLKHPVSAGQAAILAAVGAVAVWASFPAVFVLAAVGLVAAVEAWRRGHVVRIVAAIAAWLASFAACFAVSLRSVHGNEAMHDAWAHLFMPLPPTSPDDVDWLLDMPFALLRGPAGLPFEGIAGLLLLAGVWAMLRARPAQASMLLGTVLIALLASGLRLYPFGDRFALYLVPILALFVARGAELVAERTREAAPALAPALVGLLLLFPSLIAMKAAVLPRQPEHIRPVLAHLGEQYRESDIIYVYYATQYAFKYYAPRFGLPADFELDPYVEPEAGMPVREWRPEGRAWVGTSSRRDPSQYLREADALRAHPRAWLVFSHVSDSQGLNEERLMLFHLDRFGRRVVERHGNGVSLYLYEFPDQPAPTGDVAAADPPRPDR